MKRNLLLAILSLLTVSLAFGQTTVTGVVTSTEDGEPIPGVSVVVKNTIVGVTTDIDGNYTIDVPADRNVLVFSYIGMQSQEVMVDGRTSINVSLESAVLGLDEVVVTAIGIEREKKALGYATQVVDGDDLNQAKEANFLSSLQGKVAGVQINSGTGLGASTRILLRGVTSIDGNNQPLFVVDGIPLNNTNFTSTDQARGGGGYDYGSSISDINPDDIESITVLKGANATALYGSRGSNGVIVVTTKSGGERKGIGVTVNSSLQFNSVSLLPDYQDEYGGGPSVSSMAPRGYMDNSGYYNFPVSVTTSGGTTTYQSFDLIANYSYDGSWGPAFSQTAQGHLDYLGGLSAYDFPNGTSGATDGTIMYRPYYSWYPQDPDYGTSVPWEARPDNIKNFYESGILATNNVALTGGNETTNFRLSYTNLSQKGTVPNSQLGRNTLAFSGKADLSERFTAKATVNYVVNKAEGRPSTGYDDGTASNFNQWFQRQVDMERMEEHYENPDGTQQTWNIRSTSNLTPQYWDNPYWDRYKNYQNDQRNRVFGKVEANYRFTDWLSMVGRVGTDYYTERREERIAPGSYEISEYVQNVYSVQETNTDLFLRGVGYLGEDFSMDARVGGNIRFNSERRNESSTVGGLAVPGLYTISNSINPAAATSELYEKQLNALYALVSLGYKNYLYLDLTGRNDWSSTLPLENYSYFYPSASLSLVFSELIDFDALSFGKLRLGLSKVGNDTDPYKLNTSYFASANSNLPSYSLSNTLANAELRPENQTSYEVGTELNFYNGGLYVDFTYYYTSTKDQILDVASSGATGFTRRVVNAGEIVNKGIELMLNARPIHTDNLSWEIGLNFAKNTNEVKELFTDQFGNEVTSITYTSIFGPQLQARVGESWGTIVGTNFVYDDAGNKLVDENGTYLVSDEVEPLGSVLADFTGGINTRLTYKGVSLYLLFDFQKGGSIWSLSNMWGKYSGLYEETVENNIREEGIVVEGVYAPGTTVGGQDVSGAPNATVLDAQSHFFLNQGYIINAADVYDAGFFKFREVRLSYTLPNSVLANSFIKGLSISLVGRNLAILAKNLPHFDPEHALSISNIQGFEGGALPPERSIGINLNVKL